MADVGKLLERGVGVAVALETISLALILVKKDFVLERPGVPDPHDVDGLFRKGLPFLELARMKFDSCDSFDLVHCCSLSKSRSMFGSRLVPALTRKAAMPGPTLVAPPTLSSVNPRATSRSSCRFRPVSFDVSVGREVRMKRAPNISADGEGGDRDPQLMDVEDFGEGFTPNAEIAKVRFK